MLPDGSLRWFQGRGSPIKDADGTIESWIGVGIDITESKQIEQELRDYEYETRLAFSAGHMGSWRWNGRAGTGLLVAGARGPRRRRAGELRRDLGIVRPADPGRGRTAAP